MTGLPTLTAVSVKETTSTRPGPDVAGVGTDSEPSEVDNTSSLKRGSILDVVRGKLRLWDVAALLGIAVVLAVAPASWLMSLRTTQMDSTDPGQPRAGQFRALTDLPAGLPRSSTSPTIQNVTELVTDTFGGEIGKQLGYIAGFHGESLLADLGITCFCADAPTAVEPRSDYLALPLVRLQFGGCDHRAYPSRSTKTR